MSDPRGINYPDNPELRKHLADEIRKVQEQPERQEAVSRAERWSDYVADVVQRLQSNGGHSAEGNK